MCCSERALLAITLSNETDEILAHAAFLDYPNVAGVDPAEWVDWLHVYFDAAGCNSLNTVFVHYFVSKVDCAHGCARELVCTLFNAIPEVHYCLLAVPVGVEPGLPWAVFLNHLVAFKLSCLQCFDTWLGVRIQEEHPVRKI